MALTSSQLSTKSGKPRGRRKSRKSRTLHKANGAISARVKKIGADKFALVCIDPAKDRSEWMMADYFGNLLVEPRTVEHQPVHLQLMVELIREAQLQHNIGDMIVTIERTGNYHQTIQRLLKRAGWEVRIVHPFATRQYRLPADAGIKTDATDLCAQHRAAVAGFGLCEAPLLPLESQLRLRVRHRRDLVQKSSGLDCQIREHLHLAMPRFANQFANLFSHQAAMLIASQFESPQAIVRSSRAELEQCLRKKKVSFQSRTIEKIIAWAQQAVKLVESHEQALLHHAVWTDLFDLRQQIRAKITQLESNIAADLVRTPYIRLLAIPGINVVSAADFAAEMGSITRYANANAITGRAGLFPSRYQSDQTDVAGGLVRMANRRLRAALMQVADNLAKVNNHFRQDAYEQEARGIDKRAVRVRIAKRFSRLAFACVAGDQPLRHPCCRDPNSIIEKLRAFHYAHRTSPMQALADMETAVSQLPYDTLGYEAEVVAMSLEQQNQQRRGPTRLGDLLPAVLAKLSLQRQAKTDKETTASD